MDKTVEWLLTGDPWVVYRTRIDLLNQPEKDSEVLKARKEMIGHPKIQRVLKELTNWPGVVLASHRSANQSFHKLSFMADLGLRKGDAQIKQITKKILAHQSEEGPFQLSMNISKNYGGTGKDIWAWALCDAPVIVYSLIKFGWAKDKKVKKAIDYLAGLIQDNGWRCVVSKELGKFRGPGRKDDPCPYATLVMLKMLSHLPEYQNSPAVHTGAESLLHLLQKSKEVHPYMFYMGTDFRKIKAPLIWYDLLHVLDVLTMLPWLKKDARLKEMIKILKSKETKDGRFIPESEYKVWKDWDFGQKKEPSRWITLLAKRIIKRVEA